MSVDLHRIGTGISSGNSRNGFGNIVSFPSVPAPFIQYFDEYTQVTTTYYTTGKVYGDLIIAGLIDNTLSANQVFLPELADSFLKVKYDTFNVFYDGAGGYYTEVIEQGLGWANGTNLYSNELGNFSPFLRFVYVTEIGEHFEDGTSHDYVADGIGGYRLENTTGAFFLEDEIFAYTDDGNSNPIRWNGTGGYYIDTN